MASDKTVLLFVTAALPRQRIEIFLYESYKPKDTSKQWLLVTDPAKSVIDLGTPLTTCPLPDDLMSNNKFMGASFKQLRDYTRQIVSSAADAFTDKAFLVLDNRSVQENSVLVYSLMEYEPGYELYDSGEVNEDEAAKRTFYERFGHEFSYDSNSEGESENQPPSESITAPRKFYVRFRTTFRNAQAVMANVLEFSSTYSFLACSAPGADKGEIDALKAVERDVIDDDIYGSGEGLDRSEEEMVEFFRREGKVLATV